MSPASKSKRGRMSALRRPETDAAPIFELCRGVYATELLAAAVVHFGVFEKLKAGPLGLRGLCRRLGLAERAGYVLLTALCAFRLLARDAKGAYRLSELARAHLLPGAPFDISQYIALAGDAADTAKFVATLKSNKPAPARETDPGAAFIFRRGMESAMDEEGRSRELTLALGGRAKNVAPFLAEAISLGRAARLLDVGGGTGLYSIAFLKKHPKLRATVLDRPEVLKVAAEMAEACGVSNRLSLLAGDMFTDPWPACDAILFSNILHDWDVPECGTLIRRAAETLPPGGLLLIHDVFLDDDLMGPLPIALYSAALFSLTEGRAYSGAEYRDWLVAAGFKPIRLKPTAIHCRVLAARKR